MTGLQQLVELLAEARRHDQACGLDCDDCRKNLAAWLLPRIQGTVPSEEIGDIILRNKAANPMGDEACLCCGAVYLKADGHKCIHRCQQDTLPRSPSAAALDEWYTDPRCERGTDASLVGGGIARHAPRCRCGWRAALAAEAAPHD